MAATLVEKAEAAPAGEVSMPEGKKEEIWWANAFFVVTVHLVALWALFNVTPSNATIWFCVATAFATLQAITAGYHRLWSHGAYKVAWPVRVVYAFFGTLGFQGSIRWWALRHRLHHRFTDTEHDPYSSARGLFYSHIGWIFIKPHYPRLRMIDGTDLEADPVVRFQHRFYIPLALFMGFVFPVAVCSLWDDTVAGLFYGGFVSRVVVWHATFCINSIAHWAGDRLFSTQSSARGNLICALITNGEGYHNFHHAFPKDYRNGVRWYDYDPTKWLIATLYYLGLASDLFMSDANEMTKAVLEVQQEHLDARKKNIKYGPAPDTLPTMTMLQVQRAVAEEHRELIVLDGCVLDVTEFKDKHPGGAKIFKAYYGKDTNRAFYGGLNNHTIAAVNLAAMYRIARLSEE